MFLKTSVLVMFACLASTYAGKRRGGRRHQRRRSSSSDGSDCSTSSSRSFSGSCENSRSSDLRVCYGREDSSYKKCFSRSGVAISGCIVFPECKSRDEGNCCKALSKIKCMIRCRCHDKDAGECPHAYNNTPYYQFGDFISFVDVVPFEHAKAAFSHRSSAKHFDTQLCDYIHSVRDYANFDTLVPYLYNVDLYNGLCRNDYDIHYLTWFVNSFALYLSNLHPRCLIRPDSKGKLCYSKTKEEIDLLCITGCNKCTFSDPAMLFNKIISSTVNRPLILEFIDHVIAQIKCCSKCSSRGCGDCSQNVYTTYESYRDTFLAALRATRHLVQEVHIRRELYFGGKLLTVFAEIPYISTNPLNPTNPTNLSTFLVIPESAIDFNKIIDF